MGNETIRLPFLENLDKRDKKSYKYEIDSIRAIIRKSFPQKNNVGLSNKVNYQPLALALNQYFLGTVLGGDEFVKENYLKSIMIEEPDSPRWVEVMEAIKFFDAKKITIENTRTITYEEIQEFNAILKSSSQNAVPTLPIQSPQVKEEKRDYPLEPEEYSNDLYVYRFYESDLFYYIQAVKKYEKPIKGDVEKLIEETIESYFNVHILYKYKIENISAKFNNDIIDVKFHFWKNDNPALVARYEFVIKNIDFGLEIANLVITKTYPHSFKNVIAAIFFKPLVIESSLLEELKSKVVLLDSERLEYKDLFLKIKRGTFLINVKQYDQFIIEHPKV